MDGDICYQGGTPPGTLHYLPQSVVETVIQDVNAGIDFVQDTTQDLLDLFESVEMSTFLPNILNSSSEPYNQLASSPDLIFSDGFEPKETLEEAAYLTVQISTVEPVNALRFNWSFDVGGEGILRIFVDGALVRQIDQRFVTLASFETEEILIGMLEPGTHEIAFRLDGFATDATSSIRLTDVELGFYELEQSSTEELIIQPDPTEGKDTYFGHNSVGGREGRPDSVELRIGGWGDLWTTFIEFDLGSSPTADAIISAKLHLYNQGATNANKGKLFRVTEFWNEADPTDTWSPAAADFGMEFQPVPDNDWWIVDVTSVVKDWVNGVYPNYGFKILGEFNTSNHVKQFPSSDYLDDPILRPKLVIEYDSSVY